jgi:hypothetical protein
MMTRAEHLAWCKQRALEYLPGDPQQALASMMSDLRKHPDTASSADPALMMLGVESVDNPSGMRRFIEGFN